MSEKRDVIINVDTGDAIKNVNNLKDAFIDTGKSADDAGKKGSEATDGISDGAKSADKSVGLLSKGFTGLGTAMKAAGIGLIVAAFALLADVLSENQGVIDFVSTAFETMKGVTRALIDSFTDAFSSVSELTGGFDATKAVIMGLITVALTPLKLQFYAIKAAILALQLGWEQSFLGKGRPEKILELQTELVETKDKIIEIGQSAIEAGKDIATNFKEAANEVGSLTSSITKNIAKINLTAIKAQASLMVQLEKDALRAEVALRSLNIQSEKNAEQQRQVRDDVNKSIDDRIKANDKLSKILDKQLAGALKLANQQIALTEAKVLEEDSDKNRLAYANALIDREQIQADIVGKRSEQIVNETALLNEKRALEDTIRESNIQAGLEAFKADDARIKNQEKFIEAKKRTLEAENTLEKRRLDEIIAREAEGTQARVDAEAEKLAIIIEYNNTVKDIEQEEIDLKRERDLERVEFDKENELISFEERRASEIERRQLLLDDETLTQEQRRILMDEFAQNDIDREKIVADAKRDIQNAQLDNLQAGFGLLKSLAGKSKGLQIAAIIGENAAGIAKQVIATQAANAQAVAHPANIPTFGAYGAAKTVQNNIALGLGIATSLVATRNAIKGLGGGGSPSGGASGGSSGSGGASSAPKSLPPEFNIVGEGSINQLTSSIAGKENSVVKAYVVSKEITSQAEFDRTIQDDATFG